MVLSNAQRQRRYVARLKAKAKAGAGDGNAALAAAKARIAELEAQGAGGDTALKAKVAALETELGLERNIARGNFRAAKRLEKEIRRFKSENRKLREDVMYLKIEVAAANDDDADKVVAMDRATVTALDKALHPDRRLNRTVAEHEADQDEAYKMLNAWRDGNKKGRRQTR